MTHYNYVSYKCFSFAQELSDKTEIWSENVLHLYYLYNSTQHFCVPCGCTEKYQIRQYKIVYKQLENGDFGNLSLRIFVFSANLLSLLLRQNGIMIFNIHISIHLKVRIN